MKWYFAVNEMTLTHPDHDFPGLMLAAVASARANTDLAPHLLYDGGDNGLIQQLRALGVVIVPHRITFHGQLDRAKPPGYNMLIAAGAFLRSEIPRLEMQDDFVLYTDCDVIFRRQPSFLDQTPRFFASAPERARGDYADLNTGVMLMNLPGLRQDLDDFLHHVVTQFQTFVAYDQCAYKQYYAGRYDLLPDAANWKPYWGAQDAEIVHFHGPKPYAVRRVLADPAYPMTEGWRHLFDRNPAAYRGFVEEWDGYRALADGMAEGSRAGIHHGAA